MGNLISFKKYLSDRWNLLDNIESRLLTVQENYESHLAEVRRAREAEMDELLEIVLRDRSLLPEEFNRSLDEAAVEVAAAFEEKIAGMDAEKLSELGKAEELRQQAMEADRALRAKNLKLDASEEKLKTRSTELLGKIQAFNAQISELGHGFGFFSNLFKMRKIADRRELLITENSEVSARIELMRKKWQEAGQEYAQELKDLQQGWKIAEEHATAVAARLEGLKNRRSRILARSTLEKVLRERKMDFPAEDTGSVICPRCGTGNAQSFHFCWACAERLQANAPGFEASLEEMTELDHHFRRFSKGVHACRGIIALVRGLKSGVDALKKSVSEMLDSESKFSLGTLVIDVPETSVEFGENFDRLGEMVEDNPGKHPLVFSDRIETMTRDRLAQEAVEQFFETMGEELSRQAKAQWE